MNPTPFLQALGSNSLQGAVLVVLVLSVQWIFRRYITPGWRCALWLLLVARLLLPISTSSTFSVYNLASVSRAAVAPPAPFRAEAVPVKSEPAATDIPMVVSGSVIEVVRESAPATPLVSPASTKPLATPSAWPRFLFGVWTIGAVLLLTRLFVLSFGLVRRVRGTACMDPEVLAILAECITRTGLRRTPVLLVTGAVSTPAVFGFLRPRLLMPPGFQSLFTQAELRHIFLHELAHIRRHDLLVNGLMALIQVVHWFNPLVWFGFARWRLDRELACDAFALGALGGTHRRDYGETILRLLQQPPVHRLTPGLIGISEDRQQLKRRISQIARFTPDRRWSVLSVVLLGSLAAVGLTDADAQKDSTPAAAPPPAAAVVTPAAATNPAAAAPPADTNRIHALTIVAKDAATNQPVAGAKVSFYGADAVTDEAGLVTLSVPIDVPFAERLQNFQVAITSPRHSSRQVMWIAASGGVRTTLPSRYEATLSAGLTVGGVVRDEHGAPIADAKILLAGTNYTGFRLGSGIQTHQEYSAVFTGGTESPVTDAQGAWRFDHFPADLSKLTITVTRPGGAQTTFVAGDEPRPPGIKETPIALNSLRAGSVVLIVKDGVTVRGLVTDEAGQPLGGVNLRARDAATRSRPYRFATDFMGRFELPNWSAARVLLTAERNGYRTTSITFLPQADAPVLKVVLAPAKPLRLRVLGENNEPIVNASVRTDPNPSATQIVDWQAVTDAEGRAVWPTAPDAPVDLWVSQKDYPHRTVKLTADETEHVIRLRRGTEKSIFVHLRVVEADSGQPVPTFEVWRRLPNSQFAPWGAPVTQGEFRHELVADEFPNGIVPGYRLQVRAPGYTGWTSEVFDFSNGDQDLVIKLAKGEVAAAADLPVPRAGEGISGDTHPGLIPLAESAARLLETGDTAAFVQATLATPKDWDVDGANAIRESASAVKRHQKALEVSAAHVLAIARRAGLAPGTMKFQVKSVGWPRNTFTSVEAGGKAMSFPFVPALTVILAGEPVGDAGRRPLHADYQLSFGTARQTPGGWRADNGIRWQTLPASLADATLLRELRLANQVAPGMEPMGTTLSGADDTSLLQLGEAVIALVKSRAASTFVTATAFSAAEAADFFERADWGSARRAAEMQTTVTAGLAIAAQAALDLQDRLGADYSDAKLTVRQVLAERPSFSRFGEIEGIRAGPIRVAFSVESTRTAKSGGSLAGNYVVVLDRAVRTNDRWYLVGDKIRWQEFPQGLLAGSELEQIAFENHVAEKGTLPPGYLAPDIKLESVTGQSAENLSSYRGKVVILEFWASWCGPCQEPMDKLQKLVTEHPEWNGRVEILTLSIDEELKDAQQHLAMKQWSNTTNRWAGIGGFKSGAARDFRLRGVPTVYVLGTDGKIRAAGHPAALDLAGMVTQQLTSGRP